MMDIVWLLLGVLTIVAIIALRHLSQRYRLNWIAWSGLGMGIGLVLFCIAWASGSLLEGVPRAASMGLVCFGMPGIILLTLSMKYVDARLDRIPFAGEAHTHSVKGEASAKEDKWPHFEMPHPDLPHIEIPHLPALSRMGKRINSSLRYLAYISLIAAFAYGLVTSQKDYETMVKIKFPLVKLTKVNDDPVVFQLGEKDADGIGNYILIQEGQGYGGPFVLGIRIMDDGKVHEVIPLEHRETPAFAKKIEDADFAAQFVTKHVAEDFIVGVDIDAVSGATITTMAATEAVRKGAHIAASQYFQLKPVWQNVPWKVGLGEVMVLTIFVLAFFPKIYRQKPWKYVYLTASIGVVGFYLNASISISSFGGLLMGFTPAVKTHIIWWTLVVGTIIGILALGKNVYCFRICPFYGIEYLLIKISGSKLKPAPIVLKRARFVANFLLWLSLMIIFLSANPALGAYEPFAMMFSLTGTGVQWYVFPIALIGSFFMSTFWCRFFCPCGHFLTQLVQVRNKIVNRFSGDK